MPRERSDGSTSWNGVWMLLAENPDVVDAAASKVTPDSVATLISISGTTGTPKGVVITQRNVAWTAESVSRTLTFPDRPRVVWDLPLAHIAERMATHYCIGLRRWRARCLSSLTSRVCSG